MRKSSPRITEDEIIDEKIATAKARVANILRIGWDPVEEFRAGRELSGREST
jgi:hypothetical protein